MFPQNIGASIRTLRKQQNMTQEVLAEKLSVDTSIISHWESGESKRRPTLEHLCQLADIFECSLEELFGEPAPAHKELRKLTQQEQQVLVDMVKFYIDVKKLF